MKTKILNSLLFSLIVSAAAAADTASLVEAETKIESASLHVDAGLLALQVEMIEKELAAAPADPALNYFRAMAHYAEGCLARAQKNPKNAGTQFEEAVKNLEQIKSGPFETEAMAFRGYLLNQLIGVKGSASAMTLGPKSGNLLGQAAGRAPANPRVMFFQGVSLVTTPEMFGGDIAAGTKLLERAEAAFGKQAKDAAVHWGQAEALAWLGIAKKKSGDLDGARKAWERALAVEPEYGWVKYVLLPSLEKSAAKSSK